MLKFTNNASATLSAAITNSATSIALTTGNGSLFPSLGAGEFFYATLVDSSNNLEIVKVTARSTDTLTVVRGQDGTTGRAFATGDKLELRAVAAGFAEMIQRDGSVPMTAALNHGGFKSTNMAEPSVSTDGATKNYVDTAAVGAVNTEAAARAAADSLLLPKAGGTMTGDLIGTSFRSNRSSENARATGFQLANGTDIGECDRSTQYYDDRASNCNGYLANGNCSGNPQYTPPNGNWWEWYSGRASQGAWANSGSYDGAGGTTYSYNPVSVGFNYDGYYLASEEIGGLEYRRNYRNCNCGAFNCRTNCNCNCDCNCTCK